MNFGCSLRETLTFWNIVYGGSAIRTSSSSAVLAKVIATRKLTFTDKWDSNYVVNGSNGDSVNVEKTKVKGPHWSRFSYCEEGSD